MRGHFLRRAVLFLTGLVVLAVVASALILWVTTSLLGLLKVSSGWSALAIVLTVILTLVFVATVLAAGAFRRMANPVGDVMAALGRVADGDYAVRVNEHGPPEARTLTRAFNAMAQRLERQEEQRRGLLMDISHELRTPLAVLQGNLEGMLDGVYPRDDAHVAMVLEETQVLARLIEDLHTVTQAESLELKLARTPTDLAEIAGESIASFRVQAEGAGVTLRLLAEPGLPRVHVDPERMRQVLSNLLSNALRYTPPGGTIRVRCSAGASQEVVLAVEDSGHGIPAEHLPHIFDRFYKSKDSRGTGLGLAIAKSLVTAHGGQITAQSAPEEGTTIRVTLPVSAS
jgi:two-component system, OmpR family, sensor histidine kinase BaeS